MIKAHLQHFIKHYNNYHRVDSKVILLKLCDLAFRISFAETVKNVIKENS